jgi:plastocyanin
MFKYVLSTFLIFIVATAGATIHIVNVSNNSFTPSNMTVAVGDTIRWIWQAGFHTTTSVSVPTGASTWDSPMTSSNTSFDYKITVAGNYTYKCSPHSASMLGAFTAEEPTSVKQFSFNKKELLVYPNPFSNILNIDLKNYSSLIKEIKITDVIGKEILTIENFSSFVKIDNNNYPIFNEIPEGVYFLAISGYSNEQQTFRIIKTGK